jgi:hypothetical protein
MLEAERQRMREQFEAEMAEMRAKMESEQATKAAMQSEMETVRAEYEARVRNLEQQAETVGPAGHEDVGGAMGVSMGGAEGAEGEEGVAVNGAGVQRRYMSEEQQEAMKK